MMDEKMEVVKRQSECLRKMIDLVTRKCEENATLERENSLLRQAIKEDDPLKNVRYYVQNGDGVALGKESIVAFQIKEISGLKEENKRLKDQREALEMMVEGQAQMIVGQREEIEKLASVAHGGIR